MIRPNSTRRPRPPASTRHPSALPGPDPREGNAHTALVKAVLLALGSRPDTRVWPHNVGVARRRDPRTGELGQVIRFGFKGQADVSGIVAGGRRLEVECKTGRATLSKEQLVFRDVITKYGGIHIVARSVEDAVAQLEAALASSGTP